MDRSDELLELGRLAEDARPYIELKVKEMREKALKALADGEPDFNVLRAEMTACRILERSLVSDINRGIDAIKQKEKNRERY